VQELESVITNQKDKEMRAVIKATTAFSTIRASQRHHNVASKLIQQCAIGSDTIRTITSTGTSTSMNNRNAISSIPLHHIDLPMDCRHRESDDDNDDDRVERSVFGDIILLQQQQQQMQQQQCLEVDPSSSSILHKNLHHLSYTSTNNNNATNRSHQLQQCRSYTMSTRTERAPQAAILALGSVALTAKAGQYAMKAYNEWKKSQPSPPAEGDAEPTNNESTTDSTTTENADTDTSKNTTDKKKPDATTGSRENIFQKYFNLGVGSKYYDGGFEDKMTRREAALILGVRESSTHKRIKEAHRKLLILNHPDTGGSTYLSGKLNEAKDLLLKGRKSR